MKKFLFSITLIFPTLLFSQIFSPVQWEFSKEELIQSNRLLKTNVLSAEALTNFSQLSNPEEKLKTVNVQNNKVNVIFIGPFDRSLSSFGSEEFDGIETFEEYMKIEKSISKSTSNEEIKEWVIVSETSSNNIFKGYDHYELESKVFKYRECINSEGDTQYHLVTNETPFYPEGGGQIGDIGEIISNSSSVTVKNTFRDGEDIIHLVDNLPIELGDTLLMKIDKNRRVSIQRNHTSTHLLQYALKKILGNHVEQRGSMLTEDFFRFDFSHQSKLSDNELSDVEKLVKSLIKDEIQCIEEKQANYNDAVKAGAIGLFSEKYGDVVRTIKFGESYELCGGTHVKNTREIEDFKIISEGSQAFGIRRIVATSNKTRIKEEELKNQAIKEKAKSEKANKILQKEIDSKNKIKIQSIKGLIIKEIKQVNGLNTFTGELDLDNKSIKELCFMLSDEIDNLFMIIFTRSPEKAFISCYISKSLTLQKGFNASNIIKDLSPIIDGSGGGQPFFATGGGKNIEAIDKALAEAEKIINLL